jgi:predicted Zn finger-like uncharacterized protein
MIIKCESCSKRFVVKDSDIPKEGRLVQCGNCSMKWHQKPTQDLRENPINKPIKNVPPIGVLNEEPSTGLFKASDGKTYKLVGVQWAQIMPSGKTGIFAKRKISSELDKLIGKKVHKKRTKKNYNLNPSKQRINMSTGGKLPDLYKPKNGIGFFGYFFLIIILSFSAIGIIKTFENDWLSYFPQDQYVFDLIDEQIKYTTETIKNIFTILKDLTSSY